MALSVLARLMRKGAFAEFEEGLESRRFSAYMPARRGTTRGSLGSIPTQPGPKTRNSDAGEQRDRQILQSPIMGAMMGGGK